MFGAIGSHFGPTSGLSNLGRVAKVVNHGVAGGAMSVLRGGKFKEGFVSAGFSQVLEVTGAYNKMGVSAGARGFAGRTKNVVVSALVGGTSSKLVGGKFANGAITGAFSRMFNDAAHAKRLSGAHLREAQRVNNLTLDQFAAEYQAWTGIELKGLNLQFTHTAFAQDLNLRGTAIMAKALDGGSLLPNPNSLDGIASSAGVAAGVAGMVKSSAAGQLFGNISTAQSLSSIFGISDPGPYETAYIKGVGSQYHLSIRLYDENQTSPIPKFQVDRA